MPASPNSFSIINKPPFTQTFQPEQMKLATGNYIYKNTSEDRTNIQALFCDHSVGLLEITEDSDALFSITTNGLKVDFELTDENKILDFVVSLHGLIYVDITGVPTHIWAPLIKASLKLNKAVKAIYTEPKSYTKILPNLPSTYYSESQYIKGLPGFFVLRNSTSANTCFIPLLGFEKSRFDIVMNSVDPRPGSTFPIIGLPGFRVEYPYESYYINRNRLTSGNLWHNIKYASAYCPFSLYYQLQKMASVHGKKLYKIGLTGTKPHLLGAVLFNLLSNENVELIYDYPKKKINNSIGVARIHIHHIDLFSRFLAQRNGSH